MRNFLVSVAFCSKFAISRDVWKKTGLCFEKRIFSHEKTKIWTFLGILLTQWLFWQFFYVWKLTVLKKCKKLLQKTFFKKNKEGSEKVCNFSRSPQHNCYFYRFLKREYFSVNLPNFFKGKSNFWRLWGSLLFQSPSAANLLPLAILKEARFSRKTRIFWKKSQLLHALSSFTMPIGFHGNFSSSHFSLLKKHIILFRKIYFFSFNPKFSKLGEIFFLQSHSAASFLPLAIFGKKQVFLSKNPYTSDEKTRFWTFLEIVFFSRFFREITYL